MPLRIGSNIPALSAQRLLAAAGEGAARIAEQLSSGLRINRASDDAAGLAIAGALRADSRITTQALRNVNDGLSLTAISKGALSQLSSITIRQRELAQQAGNGVYSSVQRAAIDSEARALTDEYNRIVATTEFNGRKLFTQNWESVVIQGGVGVENALGFALGDEIASKLTAGSYLTLNFDGKKTVVYFKVDGQGTAPSVPADSTVQVNVATLYSSRIVDLQMQNLDYTDPLSEVSWQETAFYLGQKDSTHYQLWFDPGGGSAPSWFDEDDVGIRVDVSSVITREDLAQVVTQAVNSAGILFTASDLGSGKVRIETSETGDVGGASQDGSWWIGVNTVQAGTSPDSAAGVLQKVSQGLGWLGLGYTISVEGGTTLKITGARSGDYIDAANISSNIYVTSVQDGTGLATYSLNSPYSEEVTLADFNGDGNIDFAAGLYSNRGVSVRFGNGDGTFGRAMSYYTDGTTQPIASGDLDNDGDIDLVAGNYLDSSVTALLNNGDGSFSVQQSVAISCRPRTLALSDFDNDGTLEVAAAGWNGTGAGGLSILENNGAGALSVIHQYGSTNVGGFDGLVAGDIDGDGLVDLGVTGNYWNGIRIWKGGGNCSFSPVQTYAIQASGNLGGADLDADGDFDLVYKDSAKATVLFNDGNGDFTSSITLTSQSFWNGVAIADMNGDGRPDILSSTDTTLFVALNNGAGSFSASASYTMGNVIHRLAIADISGDGAADVVAMDNNYGNPSYIRVRLNNGDGSLYSPEGDRKESVWLSFGDPRGRADIAHIDLSTRNGALAAISILTERLEKISREIGSLGANESRLETTVSRLSVDRENFEAAASRITDVDVAQAAAQLAARRILQQLGASVLAHANKSPLLAVQLLRIHS